MSYHDRAALGAIEIKSADPDPNEIVTKALADLTRAVDERIKAVETKAAVIDAIPARLDEIEAKVNRPGQTTKKDEPSEEVKSFGVYLRRGKEGLGDIETKTLRVSVDPQGGYMAPAEMSTEMLRDLIETSPIRSIASVRTTSASSVIYPKRTGITNGKWKGENQTREGSEPSFGQVEIVTKEINTYVDVSNQLLADSGGSADQEVRLSLADDFGKKEGLAFVSGDGVLAPEGFMTNADIAYTANGHATNLSADALITLMYALPTQYRRNGTWVTNSSTMAVIRKLKDGQNNYLWQPAYVAGQPETLLGRPLLEAPDMPDLASGTFPIAFGDFSSGYRVVDRQAMSILVDPYSQATNGITRIHATRRVGAAVITPAAIRKLKMATS